MKIKGWLRIIGIILIGLFILDLMILFSQHYWFFGDPADFPIRPDIHISLGTWIQLIIGSLILFSTEIVFRGHAQANKFRKIFAIGALLLAIILFTYSGISLMRIESERTAAEKNAYMSVRIIRVGRVEYPYLQYEPDAGLVNITVRNDGKELYSFRVKIWNEFDGHWQTSKKQAILSDEEIIVTFGSAEISYLDIYGAEIEVYLNESVLASFNASARFPIFLLLCGFIALVLVPIIYFYNSKKRTYKDLSKKDATINERLYAAINDLI